MRVIQFSVSKLILGVLLTFLFLVLIYCFDKGFDLEDEGLALSLASGLGSIKNSFYNYYLFFPIDFGIKELRIFKLILVLIMVLCLSKLTQPKFDFSNLFFLSIGLFCVYSLLGQSLSYNNIVFFLLFIYLIIYLKINPKNSYFLVFLLGIVVSLIFYAKFTSSLSLVIWTLILIFYNYRNSMGRIFFHSSIFILGFFLVHVFIFFLYGENIFWNVILIGFEYSTFPGNYQKSKIFEGLISSFRWVVIILSSGFLLGISTRSNLKLTKRFLFFLLFSSSLIYFFKAHYTINWLRFYEFSVAFFSIFVLGFLISRVKFEDLIGKKIELYISLFIFPFFAYIGTNVYFFEFIQLFIFFYFFLILILFEKADVTMALKNVIIVFLAFILFVRVLFNVFIFPFNQPTILSEFIEVEYFGREKIKLEINQAIYINDLKNMLNRHILPDQPIIGLYAMPGDILLSGYRNFYNPCIWNETQWKFLSSKMMSDGITKFPRVLTNNLGSVLVLYPNSLIIDSVSHYKKGKIYLLDIQLKYY
ncbi:MAG: hypothetical protein C0433_17755 [Cyclobacterium sp.]|nr:hypothetical protein [Cyclobacterium sp.]